MLKLDLLVGCLLALCVWIEVQLKLANNALMIIINTLKIRQSSGAAATRQEGLALPRAENGTGALSLIAGVGYLPAIQVRTAGADALSSGGFLC